MSYEATVRRLDGKRIKVSEFIEDATQREAALHVYLMVRSKRSKSFAAGHRIEYSELVRLHKEGRLEEMGEFAAEYRYEDYDETAWLDFMVWSREAR